MRSLNFFTASETFDIGMDLSSPVALDYLERAPFKFNSKIEKVVIKYIDQANELVLSS